VTRLTKAIEKLCTGRTNPIIGGVVINERGLLIVDSVTNGHTKDSLAAMTALLSETGQRVNENLHMGNMELLSIWSSEGFIFVSDFMIYDQRFRIGAVAQSPRPRTRFRYFFSSGKISLQTMEKRLKDVAKEIAGIMMSGT